MTDLFAFRTVRPTQRSSLLEQELVLQPELRQSQLAMSSHFTGTEPEYGPFIRELIFALANPTAGETANQTAQRLAAVFRGTELFVEPGDLRRVVQQSEAGIVGGASIDWLIGLDHWLLAQNNRPVPADFEERIKDFLPAAGTDTNAAEFRERFVAAWFRILDSLAAALLIRTGAPLAAALNRLWLVLGLLQRRFDLNAQFADSEAIYRQLRYRVATLPSPPFPEVLPLRSAQLARRVAVGDLWVVRKEWQCYAAGEIADIRNVMAGESFENRFTRIDETEITTTTSSETSSADEQEDSQTDKTDISEETDREIKLALAADAQVNVAADYGVVKIDAAADVSADFSLTDATNRASRFAHEVTSRSLSRVEQKLRSERVSRTLTRMEQSNKHGFENKDGGHINGTYRWVDRVDRLQLFRYPDRLLLEFQLPEPGRQLRALMTRPRGTSSVENPPAFLTSVAEITPATYQEMAARYKAAGVPAPPNPRIAVTHSLMAGPPNPLPSGNVWNAPAIGKDDKMAVPPGYLANAVTFSVAATPLRGSWRRENTSNQGHGDAEGFHQIVVSVAVGERLWTLRRAGADDNWTNTVQLQNPGSPNAQYADSILIRSEADVALDPGETGPGVPLAVSAVGANTVTLTLELVCVPTEQAMAEWRQTVFDTLLGAWQTQKREYQAELARLGLDRRALAERASPRNAEMIRHEIKRHIMGSLLMESPFNGKPALIEADPSFGADIHVPTAIAVADVVQFLEQAFEWGNLTYVPYPYYWAGREQWDALMDLEANDVDLARFLSAGSCRVVVPARPGFASAVNHWLTFMQPWGGGVAPLPGQPQYLDIATEIRELDQPPEGGIAAESWDIRVPTTLRWLDPATELPHNEITRLGKAPNAPKDPLCPDA
jgi:hypothetical protein